MAEQIVERFTPPPRQADDPPPPSSALIPKRPLILRVGRKLQPWVNDFIVRQSKIGNDPFPDQRHFPWIKMLEANADVIRAEAKAVLEDLNAVPSLAEVSPDHRRIAPAGKWRSYFLVGYGYRHEANCAACPRTAALVSKVPGLNSAFFSILVPGTHLPPHTGVTKAFLTSHLGIQVPREREKCRMRVVNRVVSWEENRILLFDDCFDHEVLNETDETRIVLLVQVKRPVRLLGRIIGGLFLWGVKHSRFVQDARKGVQNWTPDP
ncbi:aspartyl/asparaginyl beta-hydroxylase domain-containing protein [Sphingomonas profundi]|uniref:aspartyl/asparaginyl beta-hydroxylase domain-containing protein n=1 Tax=Alterirhizorhabdus profundi TaxID=2681549 RepID=UPI0012E90033|nr:aspartyl/asparaginyl beta-hydroxylase domain-containing protein [Sphingomonas profundi]